MTDDVKGQVAQELLAWMKAAGDFVGEQAPELAQDIVRLGIVGETFRLAIGLVMIAGATFLFRFAINPPDQCENEELAQFLSTVGGVIGALSGVIIAIKAAFDLLQVLLAPKLYVLEYLSKAVQ